MALTEEARRERNAAASRAWYAKHQQEALDRLHAKRGTVRAAKPAKPKREPVAPAKAESAWHEKYILKAPTGYCRCGPGEYCPHIPGPDKEVRPAGVPADRAYRRRGEAA